MKNWSKAEAIVKKLSGGKITIGSGNKNQRGDIRASGYCIEVKQTDLRTITLNYSWFETLEHIYSIESVEVGLCLFFYLDGHLYLMDRTRTTEAYKKWRSHRYSEPDLPDEVCTKKYVWKKYPIEELKDLT